MSEDQREQANDADARTEQTPARNAEGPDRDERLAERNRKRSPSQGTVRLGRDDSFALVRQLVRGDVGVALVTFVIAGAPAIAGARALERLVGPSPLATPWLVACAALLILTIAALRASRRRGGGTP